MNTDFNLTSPANMKHISWPGALLLVSMCGIIACDYFDRFTLNSPSVISTDPINTLMPPDVS